MHQQALSIKTTSKEGPVLRASASFAEPILGNKQSSQKKDQRRRGASESGGRQSHRKKSKKQETSMYRIALINMPFGNVATPSIALTQLKAVVTEKFKDEVSIEIVYLNHDFAKYLGLEVYTFLTDAAEAQNAGLGDWFFRDVAFPGLLDNTEAYFSRYFPVRSGKIGQFQHYFLERRRGLEGLLDRLIAKYRLDEADLVGFTSMFMQNVASFAMAAKLKQRKPGIITVMGGANCETPMGQVIAKKVRHIDYVFSGPGLKSFPDLIGHCMAGERHKCGLIKGVFSRSNSMVMPGPDDIGDELEINHPINLDYDNFIRTLADTFPRGTVKPILPFETSRGCWWGERAHCTFCGLNSQSIAYRAMTPERALSQFEALFRAAPNIPRLEAVDNILPKNYLREVLPFVKTPPHITIFYEVKADLSEEEMEILANARVKAVQPGIESLATSTLKLMRKGTSAFTNLTLLKNCVRYHIDPVWNLLVGFPGEGKEAYEGYVRNLPNLRHLPPPTGIYPVRFDRYSPYFKQADFYKLNLQPLDFYSFIYPFEKEALSQLAYYFADVNFNAGYITTMVEWMDKMKEPVNKWIGMWSKGAANRPMLVFNENGRIYDSRSGTAVEHDVGRLGAQVLHFTSKPKRVSDIARELARLPGFDAERELAALHGKGLLFNEGDRYLSLVLHPKLERVAVA